MLRTHIDARSAQQSDAAAYASRLTSSVDDHGLGLFLDDPVLGFGQSLRDDARGEVTDVAAGEDPLPVALFEPAKVMMAMLPSGLRRSRSKRLSEPLYPWLPIIRVDEKHAAHVDLTEPVLVACVADIGTTMLIDGWHRLYRAQTEGLTHLPCRVIDEERELQARVLGGRKRRPGNRTPADSVVP
ncbi:hypothetical protein [Streptomyces sp. NPDC048269]|uniref:hypothetical protein n=1 Tax=Streptomyces sp. NPDC048269 TaxID=3155753 RepID=UPI00344A5067